MTIHFFAEWSPLTLACALSLVSIQGCGGDEPADTSGETTTGGGTLTSSSSAGTTGSTTQTSDGSSGGETSAGSSGETTTSDPSTGSTSDESTTDATTGEPPPPPPVPALDPEDPRRLVIGTTPWYPAGYYPGAAINMTGPGFAGDFLGYNHALIDRLAEHGIDLFRIWFNWGNLGKGETWDAHILHPYLRTGPGNATDGGPRLDLDQFDEAYFDLADEVIAYAQERGIVVQVMVLDCWHAGFGLDHGFAPLDYFYADNNINGVGFANQDAWFDINGAPFARNLAFVEHLVDRVGHYPNLIWETCNEKKPGDHSTPQATASDPFHVAVAEAIHAREQANDFERHLVMPLDLPEHRTVAGHRTPTQNGQNQESIPAMHDRLAGEQWGWAVPLISDNDCCAGEPDAAFIRRKAWAALTAGAHLDVFNNELFRPEILDNANTSDGMRFVGYTARFVRELGVDLRGMQPADDHVQGDAWAFGRAGEAYVIYLRSPGTVTLLDVPPAASATWFNPRTAELSVASGGPAFTSPGDGDWVLYVAAG